MRAPVHGLPFTVYASGMPLSEALRLAVGSILSAKLRSFFTLLGIIVSVGFLIVVVAIIQGMNAYVKENLTGAMIGTNAFQVRRSPISVGLMDDEQLKVIAKRPLVTREDAEVVQHALPDAQAVALQSGWPTPVSDVEYGNRTVANVLAFGVTPPYQLVQDYRFAYGSPLSDPDVRERRYVVVDGIDGRTHYAEIGSLSNQDEPPVRNTIVELSSRAAEPRQTIACFVTDVMSMINVPTG